MVWVCIYITDQNWLLIAFSTSDSLEQTNYNLEFCRVVFSKTAEYGSRHGKNKAPTWAEWAPTCIFQHRMWTGPLTSVGAVALDRLAFVWRSSSSTPVSRSRAHVLRCNVVADVSFVTPGSELKRLLSLNGFSVQLFAAVFQLFQVSHGQATTFSDSGSSSWQRDQLRL
jgi:hypothetical protein